MLLYCREYHIYCDAISTAADAIYCSRCNLLQPMQENYPSGYHTNTGYMAFELSHISYHMAPEHAMLLQGTPRCSRVLHCSIGCYSTAGNTTSTAADAISTAADAIYCSRCNLLQPMQENYPSGYHTNTGYMAFELSHISYHMAPEHAMLLQGTPRCSRVLHCSIGCYSTAGNTTSTAADAISTAADAIYCSRCNLLQPMQENYPSGYHTNTGYMAFELSHISYHMAPEHAMLLQGTPRCSRVLHCSIGCYSTAGNTTSTAADAISTAADAIYCSRCNLLQPMQENYPSGYHTNTGYMAFELSHISYHMAPEHAMLLQGTPRCSRVLHCSIGCYSTAGNTTSTAAMQYLLQPMQSTAADAIYCSRCKKITPADTTLIQGIWPLNYLTYHTIWLQNMLCCSRVLHVAPGYSIAP